MAEPAWVRIQRKTFSRWCNTYLKERKIEIKNLEEDLRDGAVLHDLLEILSREEITPKPKRNAKLKLQQVENLNICLRYIASKGIKLVNMGAEDINDGNAKLALGLIWTLILRFQIETGETEDQKNARMALLEWCNRVLNPQGLSVRDFKGSWVDGRCFCGLVNAIEPGMIPLDQVPATQAFSNMERAFAEGEKNFAIPPILDPQDVIENPDDLSIMTYVSYYRAYLMANSAFAANTYAEGPGLTEAITHIEAPFTVFAVNEEGERVKRGGANIKAFLKDGSGKDVCEVKVTDKFNGTYDCHYVCPVPGQFDLFIQVGKNQIKNSPYHPNVLPGEPMPSLCEARGDGISKAVAGTPAHFEVITKDVKGNPINRGGARIVSVLKDASGDIPVTVVDNNNGTYSCTYTARTARPTTLIVEVHTDMNGKGPVKNAPFTVAIRPGASDDSMAEVVMPANHSAGHDQIRVITKDKFGNQRDEGGDKIWALLTPLSKVNYPVRDNGDGTYQVDYPPGTEGEIEVNITVNGRVVPGSPWKKAVQPNPVPSLQGRLPHHQAWEAVFRFASDSERAAILEELHVM